MNNTDTTILATATISEVKIDLPFLSKLLFPEPIKVNAKVILQADGKRKLVIETEITNGKQ